MAEAEFHYTLIFIVAYRGRQIAKWKNSHGLGLSYNLQSNKRRITAKTSNRNRIRLRENSFQSFFRMFVITDISILMKNCKIEFLSSKNMKNGDDQFDVTYPVNTHNLLD